MKTYKICPFEQPSHSGVVVRANNPLEAIQTFTNASHSNLATITSEQYECDVLVTVQNGWRFIVKRIHDDRRLRELAFSILTTDEGVKQSVWENLFGLLNDDEANRDIILGVKWHHNGGVYLPAI